MTNIYDQHRAHFPHVSAFCIARKNERIANVAFKYPRDGAGRLYCYVHFFGMPMVRGYAGGYVYDKKTAAFEDAAKKIEPAYFVDDQWRAYRKECERFRKAIDTARDGVNWSDILQSAGYSVWGAV